MQNKNECVLIDKKTCNNCGECERCDLDPKKECDNCCKCIDRESDYKGIYIDDIIDENAEAKEVENELDEWRFGEAVEDEK